MVASKIRMYSPEGLVREVQEPGPSGQKGVSPSTQCCPRPGRGTHKRPRLGELLTKARPHVWGSLTKEAVASRVRPKKAQVGSPTYGAPLPNSLLSHSRAPWGVRVIRPYDACTWCNLHFTKASHNQRKLRNNLPTSSDLEPTSLLELQMAQRLYKSEPRCSSFKLTKNFRLQVATRSARTRHNGSFRGYSENIASSK